MVEGIEPIGEGLDDIVVARIDEISAIEGADRIRRVVVDAGAGPVEVVCGAWNFEVGDLVPLAPVGAVLPGGFTIGRRKMKGVVSNGMLCSGRELGLSEDHAGLLVLNDVDGAVPGRLVRPRPWASSPMSSSTSPWRPTDPMPGVWPGWPATWPPGWTSRSPFPTPGARTRPAGTAPRRWTDRWPRSEWTT